jgi:hypothetical protein
MVEDVGPETHWRGQADTFDRRVRWLVLVSLLIHTPLTPLVALLGLFGFLAAPDESPLDLPPITAIPVDIFEEETPPPALPEPPPSDPVPVAAPTPGKAAPEVVKTVPADGGADAGRPDAGALTDAGADAGTLGDGGFDGGIAEPVALQPPRALVWRQSGKLARLLLVPEGNGERHGGACLVQAGVGDHGPFPHLGALEGRRAAMAESGRRHRDIRK